MSPHFSMENQTFNSPFLQLEGLAVTEQNFYPTFLFFLVFYVLIMVSNIGIVLLITMERSLHEPMYILFCNLPFNDVFGNSAVVPRIMLDILKPASERYIRYTDCVTQAFFYHMYTTASHTILMAMAFDSKSKTDSKSDNPDCPPFSYFKLSYHFSMENLTFNSPVLQLEGLVISEQTLYPTFLIFLIFYVLIMVANIGIILLITMERSLHEPMYILFCNLPFNDAFGNSVIVPRLLGDILTPMTERYINYIDCVIQAFCFHMYVAASHTVLMAMAFDRYVAICNPLRYTAIMTTKMVAKLTASAWGVALFIVSILIGLTIRLNRCGTLILNLYCDNASLFKLSCENNYINNVNGLTYTVALFVFSLGCIVLTYAKITAVCITSKNKTVNSKALKTCSTHLTVYLIMWVSGFTMIILHRFAGYADYRKGAALLFHVGPGILNPVIYALQTTEIRHTLLKILHSKKVTP
ncbi:hypothetical protein NFI96_027469 [Prochilodus magdalenae]|nr:hypothetical protein NFI96_027469 [Prochilodus magdalenae]